jgi:hypothetical protein
MTDWTRFPNFSAAEMAYPCCGRAATVFWTYDA